MCPTIGHKLINDHGTAPGAWFEDKNGHCAALMPGVPREMKAMWTEQVRPILQMRQNCTIHSRTLRVLGGESAIASKVAPLFEAANPTAAIYCKTGECEIRVTARETTAQQAEDACNARIAEFKRYWARPPMTWTCPRWNTRLCALCVSTACTPPRRKAAPAV